MHLHSFILADDDTNWLKFLPAVVVVGIWLLGIGSAIFKRTGREQKTPIVPIAPFTGRPDSPSAPPPMARPARPMVAKARPPVGRPGALARMRTNAMFAARQAEAIRQLVAGVRPPAPQRREPVPPKRRQAVAEPAPPPQPEFAPTTATQPTPSLVDGRALARRMQPALLRYQFILAEVLRPPLALRDEGFD